MEYDWDRIEHLFKIGIFASLLVLIGGDMLLGWGVSDPSLSGLEKYFSRYRYVSEVRLFWAALLGMIGIFIETLCFFGIHRLMVVKAPKEAHLYRAGLIGMTAFGPFTHVMCCVVIYYHNAIYGIEPSIAVAKTMDFAKFFLLPVAAAYLLFFFLMNITQIRAFAQKKTPYPAWCWIFNMFTGFVDIAVTKLFGNKPWANALGVGWLSVGTLVTFAGLLVFIKKAKSA